MTVRKYSLTKNEIISAIKYEPLGAKSPGWISGNPQTKTCRVCAVGGVLRHLSSIRKTAPKFDEQALENACWDNVPDGADACQREADIFGVLRHTPTETEVLEQYGPLAALSSLYEKEARKHQPVAKTRKTLIKFVRSAAFPKRVKIEVQA